MYLYKRRTIFFINIKSQLNEDKGCIVTNSTYTHQQTYFIILYKKEKYTIVVITVLGGIKGT